MVSYNLNSFINGYISIMRNIFLLSSIGIAAMTYSNKYKEYKKHIQILSLLITIFSIVYGVISIIDSNKYIDYIEKQEDLPEINVMMLNQWKNYIKLSWIYIILISILAVIILKRRIFI